MDYMKTTFVAGKKYGFIAKIVVPIATPTDSVNRFTIEFGYDQLTLASRYQVGASMAEPVRKLNNAAVAYETALAGAQQKITFTLQTITVIPRGGGIVIIGPPNFIFDEVCEPIINSDSGSLATTGGVEIQDLPYDSTCVFF